LTFVAANLNLKQVAENKNILSLCKEIKIFHLSLNKGNSSVWPNACEA